MPLYLIRDLIRALELDDGSRNGKANESDSGFPRQRYASATNFIFDEALVVTNARTVEGRVKRQLPTYGVTLIDLKSIKRMMKTHMVTERDVMRRLGKRRYNVS